MSTDPTNESADFRRATDAEIRTARAWVTFWCADWADSEDRQQAIDEEYIQALEILIFANGGRSAPGGMPCPEEGWLAAAAQLRGEPVETDQRRPTITVLCGSTRFYDAFQRANYDLTMAGHIVLTVGFYPHAPEVHGEGVGCTAEQKVALDDLHKRKIDLADEVLVLNVGGYIGDSTRSEIEYAIVRDKPIRYLELAMSP